MCVTHISKDGVSLADRIRDALKSSVRVVVDIVDDCTESTQVDITHGDVSLRGAKDDPPEHDAWRGAAGDRTGAEALAGSKVRLFLPSFRVHRGTLRLSGLLVVASGENRVQEGQLCCTDCYISSKHGCGILCLQQAKVYLTDSEIAHCMRSGVGVNGKNTQIELRRCTISQNQYSGIGVNHQARSIVLCDNLITENGYHGIWLNTDVVAHMIGGEISGNKLSDIDHGPGVLRVSHSVDF